VEKYDKLVCDNDCRGEWLSQNATGEDAPGYIGPIETECDWCGDDLELKPSRNRRSKRNFCDVECYALWQENERVFSNSREVVDCHNCGCEIDVPQWKLEDTNRQFCDKACYSEWQSESDFMKGENSPVWNGGHYRYGPGWNERKKTAVRERDNYECQDCGMDQDDHLDEYGRKLPVHHLIPARDFDNPEKRNAMDNLITLCDRCHPVWEKMAPLRPV